MRILIADDQRTTRTSLRRLLATVPTVTEIREAADGKAAVELLAEWQPDVVVMDARMPELDGVEATRLIRARWPGIRIIILSMYQEYQAEAMLAGACAFVSKGAPPHELVDTLFERSD